MPLKTAATLDVPAILEAREAALDHPRMAPLNAVIEALRGRHGEVPWADPLDGGADARLLLLLETPGPARAGPRFVSRDNPTGTAANLRRFLATADWPREATLIWNAVPWVIHAPGARNRTPRAGEIAAGVAELPDLLARLPHLTAVVLAGRVAARAAPVIARHAAHLPVWTMPHPSPTIVCTSPAIAVRIGTALTAARRTLGD